MIIEIVKSLMNKPEKTKIILLAPVRNVTDPTSVISDMQKSGFVRLRYKGAFIDLEELNDQWDEGQSDIEIVIDRLVVRSGVESRLADSVETCLRICGAEARAAVMLPDEETWEDISFSTSYRNPKTGFELPSLEPKNFSFNSHSGACPVCHGIGTEQFCDPDLIVPDHTKTIEQGAVKLWGGTKKKKGWIQQQVESLAIHFKVKQDVPFAKLPKKFKQILFYGTDGKKVTMHWEKDDKVVPYDKVFEGVCHTVERLFRESPSDAVRKSMAKYMTFRPCESCSGMRLKPEILAVKLDHEDTPLGIQQLCTMSVEEIPNWLEGVVISSERKEVLNNLLLEVKKRVEFMQQVGLGYLTLNRASNTLSGGEAQRIRLATQLGAGLGGVIYVLDEPSIGLHQEDNFKLIQALKSLRDIGNTVIVVEHDEETIREADWVIDIGPGAGQHSTGSIIIKNANEHNLSNINVEIPLGLMVAVTGPSGSGKSTLIHTILYRALARHFYNAKAIPGDHGGVEGIEQIEKVTIVDQQPIGKSPRSNPATYTGLLDHVRSLFAQLPLSRQRGYKQGRFSFNVKGGRCEKCQGDGHLKIDMHFLTDAYVVCDSCEGKRYNRETLEVLYKGKSIADVLAMTAEEANEFFSAVPKLDQILTALCDVGLGYLVLGQPANTLSGGEAQRIKLATELAKPNAGNCLYIFDEPTTGLHFGDVDILLTVLERLRDNGNSVLIIEHNMDVIRRSDWIIDLGPAGGKYGGNLVVEGSPEDVKKCEKSLTGKWL